jgi:hypothetical protein
MTHPDGEHADVGGRLADLECPGTESGRIGALNKSPSRPSPATSVAIMTYLELPGEERGVAGALSGYDTAPSVPGIAERRIQREHVRLVTAAERSGRLKIRPAAAVIAKVGWLFQPPGDHRC